MLQPSKKAFSGNASSLEQSLPTSLIKAPRPYDTIIIIQTGAIAKQPNSLTREPTLKHVNTAQLARPSPGMDRDLKVPPLRITVYGSKPHMGFPKTGSLPVSMSKGSKTGPNVAFPLQGVEAGRLLRGSFDSCVWGVRFRVPLNCSIRATILI